MLFIQGILLIAHQEESNYSSGFPFWISQFP